jgi:hypothetical protein
MVTFTQLIATLPQTLMIIKIEEPVYPSLVFDAVIKFKDKNEK